MIILSRVVKNGYRLIRGKKLNIGGAKQTGRKIDAPKLGLLLLLLSRFSRVRLCTTPETAAHQVPPSLGISRQEHWSGLPFPSPKTVSRWGLRLD